MDSFSELPAEYGLFFWITSGICSFFLDPVFSKWVWAKLKSKIFNSKMEKCMFKFFYYLKHLFNHMIAMFYIVSSSFVQIFVYLTLCIELYGFFKSSLLPFFKACVKVVYMTPWLSCCQWAFALEVAAWIP